ncbi:mRNA splicing protein prp18 [Scheffersomyces spartinae]|uniref:Pre-mRNA-splicing factor 18 n=1 Tax=Scheffersomyces spartinae TaxID=45513 RepID=A0A9P8AIL9_9ASCO|nr:mRNA splicing protein prp18 [Scheffersomyces spartinae]KAG7194518.1 mRNA splicing protein prp18 [Scheffersomyces spartinae]
MDFDALFGKELRKKTKKKKKEKEFKKSDEPEASPLKESSSDAIEAKEILLVTEAIDNDVLEKTWKEMVGGDNNNTDNDGDCNFNKLSKEEKLLRLSQQIHSEEKKHAYKLQLDLEAETDVTVIIEQVTDANYTDKIYLQLRKYFKSLIVQWENDLQSDRQQARILYETKRDMVPLLYKLRTHRLKPEMIITLGTIVHQLQNHQFLQANESYLKLSIGNVAWPIGVQNVGIHARSASLRIEGKSANIMISNTTRKWITAIKRLISFSERRYSSLN